MNQNEKEERLWLHSEKLAIAWALISHSFNNNFDNEVIIMYNNLRVCKDCHEVMKLMTKLFNRKFVLRDANRFHHFENGLCSCNNYW